MKLYYIPYTCSLSPDIVLRELGVDFDLIRVDKESKRTADGRDFLQINPKGYVAAVELDNGEVLTEGPAIIQYLADQYPESGLAPANGTLARTRLQEWLNYITSELHHGSAVLFNDFLSDEVKAKFRLKLDERMRIVEARLAEHEYLFGERFSVADAYLFTVLSWFKFLGIDLATWPATQRYLRATARRPSVRDALMGQSAA
ncbi:glutathione transferase GstA [Paludibacterium purpuratum]|uniref:Glutathione S-transferase n=1 Tax=Paludibacterium purpuratum TaxID=1144873 RepID=A0A4R7BEL5_9NEIS|nr:glutathione transferase GstA [Paludibacterium purpuratum]TDR82702.1 glutathione S-transferase [Paludibacterium purpuratum]